MMATVEKNDGITSCERRDDVSIPEVNLWVFLFCFIFDRKIREIGKKKTGGF